MHFWIAILPFYALLVAFCAAVALLTSKGRRWLKTKWRALTSQRSPSWAEPVQEPGIIGWLRRSPRRVYPCLITPSVIALSFLTRAAYIAVSHKTFVAGVAVVDVVVLTILGILVINLLKQTWQAIREVNASGWMRAYHLIEH